MRPRFSIRFLLIFTAFVGISLYVLFVRPTAVAETFVNAANNQDFEYLIRCFQTSNRNTIGFDNISRPLSGSGPHTIDRAGAKLLPRSWNDLFGCRRRIVLSISGSTHSTSSEPGEKIVAGWENKTTVKAGIFKVSVDPFPFSQYEEVSK